MSTDTMDQHVEDLDRRVGRVEQILPALATKSDLAAAVEPLVTRAELRARTHFDVVAESLRDDLRLIAEGLAALSQRMG